MKKMMMFLIGGSFVSMVHANQVLTMADTKRLEAVINSESMNRIAVANDRITQIFGDEGTFESQNDETTGQIFLKPSAENGTKDLSLTIITEQGVTQDLTLKPTAKSATTVILKNTKTSQILPGPGVQQPSSQPQEMGFSMDKSMSAQNQILDVLKLAVMGQLPLLEESSPSRKAPDGFDLTPLYSYQGGPYIVHVFYVQNTTDTDIEIQDTLFYRSGDLALSFQSRVVPKNTKTRMYVVTYGGAYHE